MNRRVGRTAGSTVATGLFDDGSSASGRPPSERTQLDCLAYLQRRHTPEGNCDCASAEALVAASHRDRLQTVGKHPIPHNAARRYPFLHRRLSANRQSAKLADRSAEDSWGNDDRDC